MNGINNNIAFRGAIGDKFVQEITIHRRSVTTTALMQASKGKLVGLDSVKVGDIFESFISGLIKETNEKLSLQDRIDSLRQEVPKRIEEAIKSTEESLFSAFRRAMEEKDKTIDEYHSMTLDLQKYKEMAHVKSLEELDTVMPETAIATVREMNEHKGEAEESMLTYLLTGQGQQKALEQTERAQILVKAMADGITDIPEVADAIKENNPRFAETRYFLSHMMGDVLREEKASVVIAPVFKEQIKKNMLGLLTPYADERYSNTGRNSIVREVDSILDYSVEFHKNLAQRRQELKKEYPNAAKIVYNRQNNEIETYDSNGELINSRMFFY